MDDVIDFLDESFEEISALDGSFVEVAVGVEEEAGPDTHTPSSSLQSCTMCDKKFKLKSSLKRHIRKKHDNAALHCSSCKITFNNNEDRKDHNINVHTKSHICENCGKKLLSKQGLSFHRATQHGADLKEKKICPYPECSKVFIKARVFRDHLNQHAEHRPYSCDKCEKTYSNRYERNRHIKFCGKIDSRKCSQCEKSFSSRANLYIHKEAMHRGKRFDCHCGKTFKYVTGLRKHEKMKGHRPN